ncbi:hypothetical protein AVEN_264820-1 [Araneus ventricosus]|uniref:Uncharacterized protein n=1 Tax=Araneus ventricosus TaxID=182803 RepID=A0A4Y2E0I1_ARAVE|nr:hypothetical protein AVEN_264820-1 [Araneus ventricosus]
MTVKPAGVFSPKLSRTLPQKDAVSPSSAWRKEFEPTVIQNPMTIRRFFIIVIEKYLGNSTVIRFCVYLELILPFSGTLIGYSWYLPSQKNSCFRSKFDVDVKERCDHGSGLIGVPGQVHSS